MPLLLRNIYSMLGVINKSIRINKQSYQIIRILSSKEVISAKNLNQDYLLLNLKNATTTYNLLEMISSHHKIMNCNHVIQAFRTIFALQKNGDKSASTDDILSHPNFKSLCVSLKSNIRSIEINELVETLKTLSYIGVKSKSIIMQTILQMIRQNINQLSLQQIIFMDFILKQFESTPLSDALLIAFPIVFEIQLHMKADTENLTQLADLLQYATKQKLSDKTIDFLLNAIYKHKNIHSKIALSIIWSICELKQDESFEPILKRLLKIVCAHSDDLKIFELETTLTKMILRFNKKYPFYFQEEFFKIVAENVIKNDLGFQQAIWIIQKFSKVGYSHDGLLDYLSTFCHNDINVIAKMNSWNLYNLVTGLSNTDYRPIHWESIKQAILENKNIFDGKRKFNWIKFATRLAILDIYIPQVLQRSLREENIEETLQEGSHAGSENFLILYQTISTLRPEFSNMLPNKFYIDKAMRDVYLWPLEENYRPLKGALERGLGDESYVLNNVATKLGHLLHHVVVMRKGGYPISFEEKHPLILEDLSIPSESHIICIFGCDSSYYKLDTNILRTIYPLMFKTLEANGYSVITICLETWNSLLDHEKIPYLMQSIREKNEEFTNLSVAQPV